MRTSSAYVAATNTTTTVTYVVNLLDQVTAETRTDGSVAKSLYDPVANVTDRCYWAVAPTPAEPCKPVGSSFTTLPTRHTTTSFDARNNRVRLDDASTKATTTYDPDHNYQTKAVYVPTKMTGSAVDVEHQTSYGYDERHRLVSISHQRCTRLDPASQTDRTCSASAPTGSLAYEYDANDNRTRVNGTNGATSADRRYCYDAQDRLQYRNTGAACSASAKDETYAYDPPGNRTQAVVGGVTTNFTYNDKGQLCNAGATNCSTQNVTYDPAGRTKTWNGWWLTYDAEGRLSSACKSETCPTTADRVTMTYDGEGRRTAIASRPGGGTESVRTFRYQGDAIVEERVDGVLDRQYLVDEAGSIVAMVIPSGPRAGTYLVTYDGHGDALALWRIKPDGHLEPANSYVYSSWGSPQPTTAHTNSANGGACRLAVTPQPPGARIAAATSAGR